MKRTEVLQEVRKMRFEEAYYDWQEGRLSQQEAESCGMGGLMDKRLSQASCRRAPVDEVMGCRTSIEVSIVDGM